MTEYFAVENDVVGGWDISPYNKPISEHARHEQTIAWGLTQKNAELIAMLLTEHQPEMERLP